MKFQILAAAVVATLTGFAAADCGRVFIDELTPPPAGCTRHTKKGDFVTVDYKGYFPNGTLFDQSYGSPDGPLVLPLLSSSFFFFCSEHASNKIADFIDSPTNMVSDMSSRVSMRD